MGEVDALGGSRLRWDGRFGHGHPAAEGSSEDYPRLNAKTLDAACSPATIAST